MKIEVESLSPEDLITAGAMVAGIAGMITGLVVVNIPLLVFCMLFLLVFVGVITIAEKYNAC